MHVDGVFKLALFEKFLVRHGIPWARLESGTLDMSEDTFRQAAKVYPIISPLRELRHTLAELRLNRLTVGEDGRGRTPLWAFSSKTGRNQPSNNKYIFGPSVWIRGLIRPPPGAGVAYIDWSSQEIGIAGALSGDANLQAAYLAGDVYLAFGKQAGRLPPDATKETHGSERELLKQCVLGIGYGMEAQTLAFRIGQPEVVARELLRAHRNTYPNFLELVELPRWILRCRAARCERCSVGRSTWAKIRIRDPCAISRCKETAPRCCAWRAVWPPSAALKCAGQSTTPC